MNRTRAGLSASVLLLAFAGPGCYEFDAPLDPTPQVAVDPSLVGSWRCLSVPDPDEPAYGLAFTATDDRRYSITMLAGKETATGGQEAEAGSGAGSEANAESEDVFDAYTSRVDGDTVLNVRGRKDRGQARWVYVRYSLLRPDVLRLELADDDVLEPKAQTTPELRAALHRQRRDPKLYVPFCVCVRAPRPKPSPSPVS